MCKSKCKSASDWSAFQLTAVIFDWGFSHSPPLSISYFPCPTTGQLGSCTLQEKKLAYAWVLGLSGGVQGVRGGLGNDVFTSEHEHLHEMQIYFSMTNMYICMR